MPKISKSQMLTDKEVRSIDEDTLQSKPLAETLKQIISTSRTPLTIGVYGEWGCGKTSLMRMTENSLKKKKEKDKKKGKDEKKILTVWFDAWKYEKAYDLRVALIHTILKEIEKDEEVIKRVKRKAIKLLKRVTLHGLKTAPFVSIKSREPTEEKTLKLIGDFVIEFENLVKEAVGEGKSTVGEKGKDDKGGRLVVFIDDLDRCIPEKTIDIIEAIKLFLNVPQSVFVIAADKNVIIEGISQKYKGMSPNWGRNYLEKIVQVPFTITPISKKVIIDDFMKELYESKAMKKNAYIPSEAVNTQETIRRYNPRTLKKLINKFELQRILIDKRRIIDKRFKLKDEMLVKLFVLEIGWPDFYTNLIRLFSESDGKLNLIEMFYDLESRTAEWSKHLKNIKHYYDNERLRSFLQEPPRISDADLTDYLYLHRTIEVEKDESKEDAGSHFNLGYASSANEDYDKAIEHYTKSIELDPGYADTYLNRGNAYVNRRDINRAIKDYNKAIELDPKYTKAYSNRGNAYRNKKRYERAIEDYNKAIEIDPKYVDTYNNLKDLLEHLNKHQEFIPKKWDSSSIEKAINNSEFDQSQKDSIITLLKSLKT